jgi:muconolactone delta-isomerase
MIKRLRQATRLTPQQVAEVERARREAREDLFATEGEMNDVWRRFGVCRSFPFERRSGKKSDGGQANSSGG